MKRILTVALSTILAILALTGCARHIEDTNGADDMTLVTLTDEDISKGTSSLTSVYLSTTNANTTSIKCKKLSGVKGIIGISGDRKKATLTYTASVTSGNFRLCLVDTASGSILADLIVDGSEHTLRLAELKSSSDSAVFSLKAAGESASFTLDYALTP